MPVIVPHVPIIRKEEPEGPPSWLQLRTDEIYVRSYGGSAGLEQRRKIMLLIATLVGLLIAAQFGFFAFRMAEDSTSVPAADGDPIPYIAIAIVALALIALLIVKVIIVRRRRELAGVLTNQRMQFQVGGKVTGFELNEIVRLVPGGENRSAAVQIYIRTLKQAAVTLPVENLGQAVAELKAYALAAGAKLR